MNDDASGMNSGSVYTFESTPAALAGEGASISLSAGGLQSMILEGGASRAGWFYFMLGSFTGSAPGINFGGGVLLPLNFDAYLNLTLTKPGLGAFGGFRGMLDGTGQALSTFTIPAGTDPSLAGVTLNHAYLAASVLGFPEFASNAVPVTLVL
ncbi:MAG: hypothetical protein ACI8TQ_002999 [Planctomycetota bacterium]|jgi:hypothetical protein